MILVVMLQLLEEFLLQCPADQLDTMRFPAEPPNYFGFVQTAMRQRRYEHDFYMMITTGGSICWEELTHSPALRVVPPHFACCSCRVLRARKYDVAEALKLVAETAAWRTSKNVAALTQKSAYEVLGCLEDELFAYYREWQE